MKQAGSKDNFYLGLSYQHTWLAEMNCCVARKCMQSRSIEGPNTDLGGTCMNDMGCRRLTLMPHKNLVICGNSEIIATDAQEYHATAACEWDPCDNLSKALEMSRATSLVSPHESRAWFKCSVMRERTSPVDRKWWNPSWASVQRLWTSKKVITCSSMRHSKYCAPYGKKADRLTFGWIRFLPRAFKGRYNWSQLPER